MIPSTIILGDTFAALSLREIGRSLFEAARDTVRDTVKDFFSPTTEKVKRFSQSVIGNFSLKTVKSSLGKSVGMKIGQEFPVMMLAFSAGQGIAYRVMPKSILEEKEGHKKEWIAWSAGIGAALTVQALSMSLSSLTGSDPMIESQAVMYLVTVSGMIVGGMQGIWVVGEELPSSFPTRMGASLTAKGVVGSLRSFVPIPYPMDLISGVVGGIIQEAAGVVAYDAKPLAKLAVVIYQTTQMKRNMYDPGELLKEALTQGLGRTEEGELKINNQLTLLPIIGQFASQIMTRFVDEKIATNTMVRLLGEYLEMIDNIQGQEEIQGVVEEIQPVREEILAVKKWLSDPLGYFAMIHEPTTRNEGEIERITNLMIDDPALLLEPAAEQVLQGRLQILRGRLQGLQNRLLGMMNQHLLNDFTLSERGVAHIFQEKFFKKISQGAGAIVEWIERQEKQLFGATLSSPGKTDLLAVHATCFFTLVIKNLQGAKRSQVLGFVEEPPLKNLEIQKFYEQLGRIVFSQYTPLFGSYARYMPIGMAGSLMTRAIPYLFNYAQFLPQELSMILANQLKRENVPPAPPPSMLQKLQAKLQNGWRSIQGSLSSALGIAQRGASKMETALIKTVQTSLHWTKQLSELRTALYDAQFGLTLAQEVKDLKPYIPQAQSYLKPVEDIVKIAYLVTKIEGLVFKAHADLKGLKEAFDTINKTVGFYLWLGQVGALEIAKDNSQSLSSLLLPLSLLGSSTAFLVGLQMDGWQAPCHFDFYKTVFEIATTVLNIYLAAYTLSLPHNISLMLSIVKFMVERKVYLTTAQNTMIRIWMSFMLAANRLRKDSSPKEVEMVDLPNHSKEYSEEVYFRRS